jgi:hypothetical protein
MLEDFTAGAAPTERRSGDDRREFASVSALLRGKHRRRKSGGRRKTDRGGYVDYYDSRTWGIVVAVLLLSFLDALLTARHLVRGSARELNPVLNEILSHGGFPAFFTAKAAMTVLPMAIIMIHKEWVLGRFAARICLLAYVLLTLYHLYLIFGIRVVG